MRLGDFFHLRGFLCLLLFLPSTRIVCHVLEDRQEPTPCSSGSYQAPIGLSFDVFCSKDIDGHEIGRATGFNITDCMDQCANLLPPLGWAPCAAVTFVESDMLCNFKDGNATSNDITDWNGEGTVDAAVAVAGQFDPLGSSCPFPDQSYQNTSNGMVFKITCGYQSYGRGYDWNNDPYYQPYHTTSFEDCMAWCSEGTPLCYGVVWGADMIRGYRNCLPKNRNISDNYIQSPFVMHTAEVMLPVDSTCDSGILVTENGKSFRRACDQRMDGNLVGQIHMPDFDACIEYCSAYANGSAACSLALYQPTAVDGFENCYLMDSSNSAGFSASGYRFAMLENDSSDTNTPTPSGEGDSNASNHHSSKLWIIGAVLGPLAAVALLAGLMILWLRRRKGTPKEASHSPAAGNTVMNSRESTHYQRSGWDATPHLAHELHGAHSEKRVPEMM